jgi:hypothetical protein
LGTNVTDNSTHKMSLVGSGRFCSAKGMELLGDANGISKEICRNGQFTEWRYCRCNVGTVAWTEAMLCTYW